MTRVGSQEEFDQILEEYGEPHVPCSFCSRSIWYPTTRAKIVSGSLRFQNSNYLTSKKIGETVYFLRMCYHCLITRHPEAIDKNPAKLFNTCNNYVKTAFVVSDSDYSLQRKSHSVTEEKIGSDAWQKYVEKQRVKNTFEHKNKSLGWTREQFDEFNRSRAITIENLIRKYGVEVGTNKWNAYVEKQRQTKSFQYMCKKYGEDLAREINKKKGLTLETFIRKYGTDGPSKFKEFVSASSKNVSKASQSIFNQLDSLISHLNLKTYYSEKNGEFGKLLSTRSYCKVDYYILDLNLAIEYYGDYWHANPKLYESTQVLHSGRTAQDIWEADENRLALLKSDHLIETLIVWQSDDITHRENELNRLRDAICSKVRESRQS